jgi:hypothetical protein
MISGNIHDINLIELTSTGCGDTQGGATLICFASSTTKSWTVLKVHGIYC